MASETSGAFDIHVAGIASFAAFTSDGLSLTHVYQQKNGSSMLYTGIHTLLTSHKLLYALEV